MEYVHSDLTKRVIAAALAVHRELGPGFLESVYEEALAYELTVEGIPFQRQVEVPVQYKGVEVGKHRVDMIVDEKVIVELKTVKEFAEIHSSVLLSYLTATNLQVGLLLNFADTSLKQRRVAGRGLTR